MQNSCSNIIATASSKRWITTKFIVVTLHSNEWMLNEIKTINRTIKLHYCSSILSISDVQFDQSNICLAHWSESEWCTLRWRQRWSWWWALSSFFTSHFLHFSLQLNYVITIASNGWAINGSQSEASENQQNMRQLAVKNEWFGKTENHRQ